MQLHKPDPDYIASGRARKNFLMALQVSFWLCGALWFITIADAYLNLNLTQFGLRPREVSGLWGIITAPLLHSGPEHMFSNTLPLLVSLTALLYLYPNSAVRVVPMIWFGSGVLAWFIGRPNVHVGASGFIYGLLAYVFIAGLMRRDFRSIAVSMLVWFMYGSMVWGVLPIRPRMSWELHLSGAILGVAMALIYQSWDRVPLKRYEWEDDDSVPDWYPDPDRKDALEDQDKRGE